jgi:energy-coupling factor transporter ATP-binding protein EcfA2
MDDGQLNIIMRPKKASRFIGYTEEQLNKILKEVRSARAVLIVGPTGSGKTTLALWLASQITTEDSIYQENIGADNGIDKIRRLIGIAERKTLSGRKRVFILDELHGATKQGRDALLTPLEAPRSDTIWIGCTNEPERLPQVMRDRMIEIATPRWTKKQLLKLAKRVAKATGRPVPKSMKDFENPRQLLKYMQVPNETAAENTKVVVAGARFVLTGLLGERPRGALYQFQYSTIMEISKACRSLVGLTLGYEKADPELVAMLKKADPKLVARIAGGCVIALRDDTKPPMVLLDLLFGAVATGFHFEEG